MKFTPHPYQQYCIDRIVSDRALGLFLDMGLGKTVITLTAVQELIYNRLQVCRCLIIAPKKVAEATWDTEAAKWDHLRHLRFSMILGSTQKRIRAACSPADVYITNRENVVWLVDYFKNAWPFDMIVIDESSSFKSSKAKRFKSLTWIRPHVQRLIELTGTPAPNSIQDLWAQLYLLDGGIRLGRTVTGFREMYFNSNTHGGHFTTYEAKEDAQKAIQDKIGDICISMKAEDYLQLPELVYDTIPVQLDSKAAKAYQQLEREMLLEVDEATIDAGSAAALSNKLLQLCNGAVYDENRSAVRSTGANWKRLRSFWSSCTGHRHWCFTISGMTSHGSLRCWRDLSYVSVYCKMHRTQRTGTPVRSTFCWHTRHLVPTG